MAQKKKPQSAGSDRQAKIQAAASSGAGSGANKIVIAAVGLPTVFGTPAAATAIIGLAGKIIAALVVLVKSAMSIAQQARSFATTAAGAVPGGKWPDDTRS